MSPLSPLGRLLSYLRPRASGSVPAPDPTWYVHTPWMMEAGVPVTQETLLTVSALYGCVRLIVDSIAPAPVSIVALEKGGRRTILADDPVGYVLNYGGSISMFPDAPTAQAVKEALFWDAMTNNGNGYAPIRWDNAGRFLALEPVESGRVTPKRVKGQFFYEVTQPEGGPVRVEPADMFHLRGPSLFGWMGDGPAYRAARALGIALAAQAHSGAMFANGAIPSGLLTSDKIVTADQAKRAKEQWIESNGGGPGKSHQIAVVGQGIKYQPVSSDAASTQLVESRKFQVSEIARFFGVPVSLLAEGAWTDLSETYLGFYKSALLPWIRRFDQEATRKLFPQKAPWRQVEHDLTSLTLGSFEKQVAALDQAVAGGLLLRNEARHVLGYNDTKGGDVMVVGASVKTLEDALKPPAPPPSPFGARPPQPDVEEDDAEDETEDAPPQRSAANVARVAVALDRFERRIAARRKDLEKNAPDSAPAKVEEERVRLLPALVAEIGALLTGEGETVMRVEAAINAVLAGEPAPLAAERWTR